MRKAQAYPLFRAGKAVLYGLILTLPLILASCGAQPPLKVQVLPPPPTLSLETPTTAPLPIEQASPTTTATPSLTPSPTVTGTTTVTATSPAATTTASFQPVGQAGSWTLLFHDEFDAPSLDTTKWNTCFFNFTVGNGCDHDQGELELYQPNEVSISNGILSLQAKKKTLTAINGKTYNYTSGMISTGPANQSASAKFTFTYGYMEIKAKVPAGKGLWPAFWTLPSDLNWPPEIDVFEILGNAPTTINMHYHYPTASGGDGDTGAAWTGNDFSADWHTYAVDWEPGSLTWYVDGIARRTYTNTNVASKPMYLLANLAVGGDWPGSPDASTAFPNSLQIDYIRVWQK